MLVYFVYLFIAGIISAVSASVKIVWHGRVRVVRRFGKYSRTLDSGLHFVIPIIETTSPSFPTGQDDLPIQTNAVATRDDVDLSIGFAVSYKITDLNKIFQETKDFRESIATITQFQLQKIIGKHSYKELKAKVADLNDEVFEALQSATQSWGLSILHAGITAISVPDAIRRASIQAASSRLASEARAYQLETLAQPIKNLGYEGISFTLESERIKALTTLAMSPNTIIMPADKFGLAPKDTSRPQMIDAKPSETE